MEKYTVGNKCKLWVLSVALTALSLPSTVFCLDAAYTPAQLVQHGIDPELPNIVCVSDLGYTVADFLEHEVVKESWQAQAQLRVIQRVHGPGYQISGLEALKFIQENIGVEQAKVLKKRIEDRAGVAHDIALGDLRYEHDKIRLNDEADRIKMIEAAKKEALFAGAKKFFTKGTVGLFVGAFAATVGSFFIAKHGIKRVFAPMPTIVKKSTLGVWNRFKKKPVSKINELVFEPVLHQKLMDLIEHNKKRIQLKQKKGKNAKELVFHDLIFEGLPGTGKTLFAEVLAIEAGFDYIIVDGPRWSQLSTKEALKSLYDILAAARKNSKPVLIFIDEADAVFPVRNSSGTSEAGLLDTKITNAWLAANPDGNDPNMLIIYATNLANKIDPAVRNRTQMVHFPVPGEQQCVETLEKYLLKKGDSFNVSIDAGIKNEEERQKLGKALHGLTQRQIMKIASVAVEEAFLNEKENIHLDDLRRYIEAAKTTAD